MIDSECVVCGRDEFSLWGEKEGCCLYQCHSCELVFFFPYPSHEKIEQQYHGEYHKDRGYDGNTEAGKLRKKMYLLDIADLKKEVPYKGRFLDVGCAEGEFLELLDDKWDKYGTDVSSTAISFAKEKGIRASTKDISEYEDGFFDVIHLRGVFEHIQNPSRFVEQANKKLNEGGILVISNTPNIGGMVPKLFRERFRLVLVDEHLNYFSNKTMEICMDKFGFEIKNVKYPYFGTPYCSFFKDLISIPLNKLTGKPSPPFWGNIFTVYARKVKNA